MVSKDANDSNPDPGSDDAALDSPEMDESELLKALGGDMDVTGGGTDVIGRDSEVTGTDGMAEENDEMIGAAEATSGATEGMAGCAADGGTGVTDDISQLVGWISRALV